MIGNVIVLQAAHIYKFFGGTLILEDATLTVQHDERVGLVGRNGSGKTTLLKIITGSLQPDTGAIIRPKTATTGYLAQDGGLLSGRTVLKEMLSVFDHLAETEKQLRELEADMGRPEVMADPAKLEKVQDEYTGLRESFSRGGGYEYESTTRSVLYGLKFSDRHLDMPVDRLSGGEKTRLALARLLLLKPDVLILDEPTNYLDMETMDWLEKHLQSYSGAILAVSHDRYFLDALAGTVYELERCRLTRYRGNYSRYLVLKAEEMERQAARYRHQQEEMARMRDFVQRNIARASTTGRAKSKLKMLERIKPLEKPANEGKKPGMAMDITRPSGEEVLVAKEIAVGFGNKILAGHISFTITRGERVALVGPNGTGKTTLLKTIAGLLTPLAGRIQAGYHLKTGYYEQEQKHMAGDKTVLHELWDDFPQLEEQGARSLLGRFLFSGDDVLKRTVDLSGGEKSRLALAKLLCTRANFLLLDEPTSHLDIAGKEALEEALLEFPGTLLFVSHDRYFINKIVTRVMELTPNGVISYPGNFDYYQARKPLVGTDKAIVRQDYRMAAGKKEFLQRKEMQREERKRQRRIDELENLVVQTEKIIADLEKELYQPEVYANHEIYKEKNASLEKLREELELHMEEWLELTE